MFTLFSKNHISKIVLSPNAEACVKLAAADLRKNFLSLSGRTEGFEFVTKEQNNAIAVTTEPVSAPDHVEGYSIEVNDDGVRITGSDTIGTVYEKEQTYRVDVYC